MKEQGNIKEIFWEDSYEPKQLYPYQKEAIEKLFSRLNEVEDNINLLFQLPTGGGKTIIFSEIARRFIEQKKHKVLILTHRIELLYQTSACLTEIGVSNKIINSSVKELSDQENYQCFTAMVETLNNRLIENKFFLDDIALVIVDEAHYNAFRKIFLYFKNVNILGVTATPLSSNKNLPLKDNYDELIVGESIAGLITNGFLSKATTYTYDVNLKSLKVGINGDYTISSLERLYGDYMMLDRLLNAYEELAKGTKTLIFNSGIFTSRCVLALFKKVGYDNVRHLDSTCSMEERRETLHWFKVTPDAILTSVSILTTGFDEPAVETILLNRATRSLTLYHQMIGRGSRVIPGKSAFTLIDLGNNTKRFGYWDAFIDWQDVFRQPNKFLERFSEEEYEETLDDYEFSPEMQERFINSGEDLYFSIKEEYDNSVQQGHKSIRALEASLQNHRRLITENADHLPEAMELLDLLKDEIAHRVKQYTNCIAKSTDNYYRWLLEKYERDLRQHLKLAYRDNNFAA